MKDKLTCERCEEKFAPINLSHDWPSRLQGKVTIRQHRISWTSISFGNIPSLTSPRISNTEMTLCDECWGSLLEWANRPNQERLKIAAENRRSAARRLEVAEARRDREVQRLMSETHVSEEGTGRG